MWQVIKSLQGEEYHFEKPKGFISNSRHIAKFSAKPNIIPQDEDTQLTQAYGEIFYQKLTKLLNSDKLLLRQKAVNTLKEQFAQKKEYRISAIRTGVVPALFKNLVDENAHVRKESLFVLSQIAELPHGRNIIIENDLKFIKNAMDDEDWEVARNAIRVLSIMSKNGNGLDFICNECIPKLIEKCKHENIEVKKAAIMCVNESLKKFGAYQIAIKKNAVEVLTELLQNEETASISAHCLSRICFNPEGVDRAVKCGTAEALCKLLSLPNLEIRRKTTEALMYVTLSNLGKQQTLDAEGAKKIIEFLPKEEDDVIIVNTLQVIRNLSENPKGRKQFLELLPDLEKLYKLGNSDIQNYAEQTIKVVTWKP